MEITFPTSRLRTLFTSKQRLVKTYGAVGARKIQTRLSQLEAANSLADMKWLPGRCHELTGDHDGQLAVDIEQPFRLVFAPTKDPPPSKADGGLDWARVDGITVIGVEDYH